MALLSWLTAWRPRRPRAWLDEARQSHRAGKLDEAERLYRRAVTAAPDDAGGWNDLGCLLLEQSRTVEAEQAFRAALRADVSLAAAHQNLGSLFSGRGEPAIAATHYARAVELDPAREESRALLAESHFAAGVALQKAGEGDRAAAHYDAALRARPGHAEANLNRGVLLEERGEAQAAVAAYRSAIACDPQLVEAHANLGMQLLLLGDLANGWAEYEWRLRYEGMIRTPGAAAKRWDGRELRGETLLLEAEQGFGDALQFIRYASLARARGARVVLRCQPELVRLLAAQPDLASVHSFGEPPPPFDFHCPLPSLPLVFGTRLDTIPARMPYLSTPAAVSERWRARMSKEPAGFKVGIAWASQSHHKTAAAKSVDAAALADLPLDGLVFYSLQKGSAAEQAPAGMVRLDKELTDFADTAAAIECLDLLISVDTAVAHLAGALGRPVWMLLKQPPDWRWLLGRETSPWYPTARLFRQIRPGDWVSALHALAAALARQT